MNALISTLQLILKLKRLLKSHLISCFDRECNIHSDFKEKFILYNAQSIISIVLLGLSSWVQNNVVLRNVYSEWYSINAKSIMSIYHLPNIQLKNIQTHSKQSGYSSSFCIRC